jgi:predicted nicotinamide N-methyase
MKIRHFAGSSRISIPHSAKMTMAEEVSASPTKPELRSSPAARAFFEALDSTNQGNNAKQSTFIQKRIQTLGWRNRYSQDDYYPVVLEPVDGGRHEFSVLQVQRGELEGTYGTGATVWPASVVLLKYLQRHSESLLREKRVVDLGSGTGVTSIGAALLGASHVICTDGEASVVKLAQDNVTRAAQQCDLGGKVDVHEYWWGSGSPPGGDGVVDVVLVSDCVLPKLYPIGPLVIALDQLLVEPGAVAILSYEHRYYPEYDPRDKFRELAIAKGLTVHAIPLEDHDPVYSTDDIEVWHVKRGQEETASRVSELP